jgi:predicted AlkP superfamily phosphohydrolase/phosphomutase
MKDHSPVLLIGLDATEIDVVDRLIAAGRLPTLAGLRARGRWGRLQTQPPNFLSLVWPTFLCSAPLGDHGWYFNKIWNPDRQRLQYVDPSWLPVRPFWTSLEPRYRVAVIDLPYLAAVPDRPNMTLLNGWQCHDDFGRLELPKGLWKQLTVRHGPPCMTPEVFGPQTAATLLAQRQEVLSGNRQIGEICGDLLTHDRHDLFLAVFGSVHRGTHYLWDLSQIDVEGMDPGTRALLEGGRDDCYASADEALARVLEAASPETRVLVFALHGMGRNDGWYEMLPRMLEQVHRGGGAAPRKGGLLYRFKKALPWTLARQVTRRIPQAWNKALVPLWSRRMHHWPSTRYFALPMDLNGYIRLNLKGREREGCVEPADANRVIAELDAALRSFRDVETGRPVIRGTIKVDDLVPPDAPRRRFLPDLVVLWDPPHPLAASSGLVSDTFGEIRWPRGRKLASGRSGNHTPHGWFVAAGPGIEPGPTTRIYDTADLIPTAFEWLGAPRPSHFAGRPIEELLGRP